VTNRLCRPACDDAAWSQPDIGVAVRSPFTTDNAHALGFGARELVVAMRCAWLECCCDLDLNQWAININFPSTSSPRMCAAKSVPMETDSAMVKRKHGRFEGRPVRPIVLQFVERYSREALLSGLARKLVGCHAAQGWAGSCFGSGLWLSSRSQFQYLLGRSPFGAEFDSRQLHR
jgi:hypothetical protein